MIDFLYKISRKLLPSFLYRVFQRSALGRVKSWEKFSTYQNIFRFYESSIKESLTDKVIAETGCGNQIYTACLFLMNGARNVVLVEPKLDLINDNRAIKNAILIFRKHYPQFLLSETDVKSKISVFRKSPPECPWTTTTNTMYILVMIHPPKLWPFTNSNWGKKLIPTRVVT
jgi:hypothetical protein